ncbi:MAG: hypothetical protein IJW98_08860 [Clostridia bacterium]|nr:hypothetical protein [Clostridia bacterium]
MEKERLTIEIGREELLRRYRIALPWWIFATVLLAGATAALIAAIYYVIGSAQEFLWVHGVAIGLCTVAWLPFAGLLFLFIVKSVRMKKMRNRILQSGLEIVEDTVRRTYEDHEVKGYGKDRQVKWLWAFEFETYGTYRMPDRWNYSWSERYKQDSQEVWRSAREGDAFYILRLRDDLTREPLQVYNQKYFWYSEDGSMTPPRTGSSWRDSVSVD